MPQPTQTFSTELTELLGIKYPIMLAGMASISNHEVAAAVSNAGGIGSFGGVSMSPSALRKEIRMCKDLLKPGAKFGVDLLLPKVSPKSPRGSGAQLPWPGGGQCSQDQQGLHRCYSPSPLKRCGRLYWCI